jgi:hypothetical protein
MSKHAFIEKRERKANDCKYREGTDCTKLKKVVPVDKRGENDRCWLRFHCEKFQKK